MNKITLFAGLIIALNSGNIAACAQNPKTGTKTTVKTKSETTRTNKPVVVKKPEQAEQPLNSAEKTPQFPGGDEAIEQYFVDALATIPLKQAAKVTLTVEINETGKVKDARIKNGYRQIENGVSVEKPEVNTVIVAAALKMPSWKPGLIKGKPAVYQQDIEFMAMSPEKAKEMSEQVYVMVEKLPEFPGGEIALQEYLKTNLKYPKDAREKKQEGMVAVQFILTRFGEIKDITIFRSPSESLSAEALRLVKGMPRWTPGKQNGNYVNIRYTLPVVFKL